ncbi:MAG: hypothetical protein AB1894_25885 [Chloroflexota bacterium]
MPIDYAALYARFDAPIAALDCGARCAPHNPHHVPFCCDTCYAVPVVYEEEWDYLSANTGLWHPWQGRSQAETRRLLCETPPGMRPVACLGHLHCQRNFRSLSCRAFPFFPYITRDDRFIGMTYDWQYEKTCWVVNNLQTVTPQFRSAFFSAFDELFTTIPGEWDSYRSLSINMRRVFGRWKRAIPLLHRNGHYYKLSPRSGRLRRADPGDFPKFGPYA